MPRLPRGVTLELFATVPTEDEKKTPEPILRNKSIDSSKLALHRAKLGANSYKTRSFKGMELTFCIHPTKMLQREARRHGTNRKGIAPINTRRICHRVLLGRFSRQFGPYPPGFEHLPVMPCFNGLPINPRPDDTLVPTLRVFRQVYRTSPVKVYHLQVHTPVFLELQHNVVGT